MDESRFVIVGGGMVAGYAAKEMAERGLKPGELTILSADTSLPYERPPLSKGFLLGKDTEESIRINPAEFYASHGIDVRLNCTVSRVDPKARRLTLRSGGEFRYDKLVLATGSRPRKLDVPGATLRNLYYLRSMNDSKTIREAAESARRAVVIGGGFIGMEVAAVLAQKKIEVTMVVSEDRIWKRLFTPEMSSFFEGYYAACGVRIVKNAKVTGFGGTDAVRSVELGKDGEIECDLVVAGVGAAPSIEILGDSGLEISDGVVVNEYLEASEPGVYAAGDIASYYDVLFSKRRRIEHWDNAVSQGQFCARLLMGDRSPFRHVPYFFSDVFDLSYEYWGDTSAAETVITRGDVTSKSFSVWWLRGKRLIAAFAMNRPDEERETAPKWIESKQPVAEDMLRNPQSAVRDAA